jgi:hypothetical protein
MNITLNTIKPNGDAKPLASFELPSGTTYKRALGICNRIATACPQIMVSLDRDGNVDTWRPMPPIVKVRVFDIEWDDAPKTAKLPTSVLVEVELTEPMSGDEINAKAVDLATDEHGYCICDCRFDILLESVPSLLAKPKPA